jgi:DNA repair protein RecO (recombination protein O)
VALVTDEAVTLAVSDYSETSQIATVITANLGKARLLAKGSKRPKNAFGGPIDRLQLVQVVFSLRPQGGLGTLTEMTQRDAFPGLRSSLKAFYAATYAAELVVAATADLDPHEDLFKILCATLRRLSCGDDSDILVYRFEARLLTSVGLMPQLGQCVSCRRNRGEAKGAFFSPAAGGVLCSQCARAGAEGLQISGKALAALLFLAAAEDGDVERVRLSPETAVDMRKLLRLYWPYVLGRPPRALRWVS